MTDTLTITRPDDWHLHLRDGAAMQAVVAHSAQHFARAIVMPNLKPPVTTTQQALEYRQRILTALPPDTDFNPLMTLYLTDNTPAAEIERAKTSGHVHGVKLYPAGVTTNSDAGVTDITRTWPALEVMADLGMPLLVHGEVTDPGTDVFDRETAFINRVLEPLLARFPHLKIVFEHITTRAAAAFVTQGPATLAATITPQHLLENRNALFRGGLRPHLYCLPVLKREEDRRALLDAALSGKPKFFLGTDSAPHAQQDKESACGCAGIYSAHAALELYAEAFAAAGELDKLEGFASFYGADFYGLPRNTDTVTLRRAPWQVPADYPFGAGKLVPYRAGETVAWKITD